MILGAAIFAVTYVLISFRPFAWLPRRPGASLLGASACVILGVLTPKEALAAIDARTLVLLLGMMGMGAFLATEGVIERVEAVLVTRTRTPGRLLGAVVWGAGFLSMLITNDAVCVLGAPILVRLIQRHRLPPLPFLLALATGANTGSVATLVGNPQNMLCASLGGLAYRGHLVLLLPVALAGLAVNQSVLALAFRRQLAGAPSLTPPSEPLPAMPAGGRLSVLVIVAATVAYLAGAPLSWSALAGFVVLLALRPRNAVRSLRQVDWSVLVFFAGLFIVVEGLVKSGVPARAFAHFPFHFASRPGDTGAGWAWAWTRVSALFLVGSNVVSNVPFILVIQPQLHLLPDPKLGWELLTMASTFAGNLTLLGSVANVIVAENARDIGGVSFVAYLAVGVPIALLTTAMGTAWLLAVF